MKTQGASWPGVLDRIKAQHPIAEPNRGFREQLVEYQNRRCTYTAVLTHTPVVKSHEEYARKFGMDKLVGNSGGNGLKGAGFH